MKLKEQAEALAEEIIVTGDMWNWTVPILQRALQKVRRETLDDAIAVRVPIEALTNHDLEAKPAFIYGTQAKEDVIRKLKEASDA